MSVSGNVCRLVVLGAACGLAACGSPDEVPFDGNPGTGGGTNTGTGGSVITPGPDPLPKPKPKPKPKPEPTPKLCAESTVIAHEKPLDMYVMMDRSGTMTKPGYVWPDGVANADCNVGGAVLNSKWCRSVNALGQFFKSPHATNKRAALQFFPLPGVYKCPTSGYETPAVGLENLPATNSSSLIGALNAETPAGEITPTEDAILGLNAYTKAKQVSGRQMISVLITDGLPNSCSKNSGPELAGLLASHLKQTGIRTYVVGMDGAEFSTLEEIAQGGGTQPHPQTVGTVSNTCGNGAASCQHWNVGNGDPAVFAAALQAIQTHAVACSHAIPKPAPGSSPQMSTLEVLTQAGSASTLTALPQVASASQCAGAGYYLDNPAAPTSVELCPASCKAIQADALAKVQVKLSCMVDEEL